MYLPKNILGLANKKSGGVWVPFIRGPLPPQGHPLSLCSLGCWCETRSCSSRLTPGALLGKWSWGQPVNLSIKMIFGFLLSRYCLPSACSSPAHPCPHPWFRQQGPLEQQHSHSPVRRSQSLKLHPQSKQGLFFLCARRVLF